MLKKRSRRIRYEVGAPRVEEMRNRPPTLTLIERDKRAAALERRTAAQTLLGDPPQGYSAYDKRSPR
jgi:hypothetical protein